MSETQAIDYTGIEIPFTDKYGRFMKTTPGVNQTINLSDISHVDMLQHLFLMFTSVYYDLGKSRDPDDLELSIYYKGMANNIADILYREDPRFMAEYHASMEADRLYHAVEED